VIVRIAWHARNVAHLVPREKYGKKEESLDKGGKRFRNVRQDAKGTRHGLFPGEKGIDQGPQKGQPRPALDRKKQGDIRRDPREAFANRLPYCNGSERKDDEVLCSICGATKGRFATRECRNSDRRLGRFRIWVLNRRKNENGARGFISGEEKERRVFKTVWRMTTWAARPGLNT